MMTRTIIDLFLIGLSVTYIIDLSGISSSINKAIWRLTQRYKPMPYDYQAKPFTCSLCMTFWISLLYLLVNYRGSLTITDFALACCNSYMTTTYLQLLITSKAIIDKLIGWLQRWANG